MFPDLLTVGHSTHPPDAFLEILKAHSVGLVVDVRTIPRSRRNPQFNRDELAASMARAGIAYQHMPALGGLRHPRKDSTNMAWRNESFRGYADYMQTEPFQEGITKLLETASRAPVAIMCAEALPWRCHRSLIADALLARGIAVEHIMSASSRQKHAMTKFARVEGDKVTYPDPVDAQLRL